MRIINNENKEIHRTYNAVNEGKTFMGDLKRVWKRNLK